MNALLCFQYCSVTLQVHGLSSTDRTRWTAADRTRWTAARLKFWAASEGVLFGRGLNLGDVSWRDCSEHIIRLINLLVQSLNILENYCALEQIWGAFAESLKAVVIFVTSVFMSLPHETARFTVDGLS